MKELGGYADQTYCSPLKRMSTIKHESHDHELKLIEEVDVDMAGKAKCGVCDMPLVGGSDPIYTCLEKDGPFHFFIHKKCAELPRQITHLNHPQHPLTLGHHFNQKLPNYPVPDANICDLCWCEINETKSVYYCEVCCDIYPVDVHSSESVTLFRYGLCVGCATVEPVLHHQGHDQHTLTLVATMISSGCDACGYLFQDMFYTCLPCQFWIHRTCAVSPSTIKLRFHEEDTLQLIYSIPQMYRNFIQHCHICKNRVMEDKWSYFCEDSGYFVHILCAATTLLASEENLEAKSEEENVVETYLELPHFPLPITDSLTAILIADYQSSNQIKDDVDDDNECDDFNDGSDPKEEDPVINHWSHEKHPLILLEEFKDGCENCSDHIHDMLVCNGCTLSISNQNKYYGCIGCNFFLHIFCANHLPQRLPEGKCSVNPQHSLLLVYYKSKITPCCLCGNITNGFMYICFICDTICDLFCGLVPKKIKHDYHIHPLVRHYTLNFDYSNGLLETCNACLDFIYCGFVYRCDTCSGIQIHQRCVFLLPKAMTHRWDSHTISLQYPPIYFKGTKYCEICELQVNQEAWLFRCTECDQCFHPECIIRPYNVKTGIMEDHLNFHHHKLTLVIQEKDRYPERIYKIFSCSQGHEHGCTGSGRGLYFQCAGCNYFLCLPCVPVPGTGNLLMPSKTLRDLREFISVVLQQASLLN